MEEFLENNNEIKNNSEIEKEVNKILNEVIEQIEQSEILHSKVGEAINSALDIGIRVICPNYLEEQVINLKNNFLNYGFKEGLNQTINDSINFGKSAMGIVNGNFESISQAQEVIKKGGTLDNVSSLIDDVVENLKDAEVIDKKLANEIKKGKNNILDNIEKNIENTFSNQLDDLEKLEKYISNWKEDFQNRDFNSMEKEIKKMEKVINSLIPIENTLNEYRTVQNLQELIKNNGKNFDLSQEELELAQKLF